MSSSRRPATVPDPADHEAHMREMAERWAREFDPNSLVTLRKAMNRFDADCAKWAPALVVFLDRLGW
jgi:homoserine acetyltransferase